MSRHFSLVAFFAFIVACTAAHSADPPPNFVLIYCDDLGYVNRQRSDPPGPQTVWLGLQRMHDFAHCWQLFGPEAQTKLELV